MVRPEVTRLYKYRHYSERTIRMLADNQVFLAAPATFNDPFDCAIESIVDIDNGDLLIELTAEQFVYFGIDKEETRNRLKSFSTLKVDVVQAICRMFKELELRQNMHGLGVLSLSEINNDVLMWAHYADKHSGFCIEYLRSSNNDLAEAKPVTYSKEYPLVNLFKTDPFTRSQLSVFTKDACWQYEKEWRRVIAEPNVTKTHIETMITAVIFGARMSEKHRENIRSMLAGRRYVKFYQANLKDHEYGLDIVPLG